MFSTAAMDLESSADISSLRGQLGMKSKPGENFLSLQLKDSTNYPLPPLYLYRSIFTCVLMNCYLYKQNPQTPSPPFLYIVEIENFHRILTPSLRTPPIIYNFLTFHIDVYYFFMVTTSFVQG